MATNLLRKHVHSFKKKKKTKITQLITKSFILVQFLISCCIWPLLKASRWVDISPKTSVTNLSPWKK